MGDRYACGLQQTAISTVDGATGTDAVGEITSFSTARPRIYDILFGHGSTPGDTVVRWQLPRQTTSATGSAAIEVALDPGAPAADALCEEEVTVGPTITANTEVMDFDLNQRATFRWIASPGGEIILPATAANGILINASSASYAGIARATLHWEE